MLKHYYAKEAQRIITPVVLKENQILFLYWLTKSCCSSSLSAIIQRLTDIFEENIGNICKSTVC